jgi:hypothetical protein
LNATPLFPGKISCLKRITGEISRSKHDLGFANEGEIMSDPAIPERFLGKILMPSRIQDQG